GVEDTPEAARTYLDACAGPTNRASTRERRDAFLENGPPMVSFLEGLGMKFTYPDGWPDYHVRAKPGGHQRGRSLEAKIYDLNRLRDWKSRFRRHFGIRALPL